MEQGKATAGVARPKGKIAVAGDGPYCPHCGERNQRKAGFVNGRQRFFCRDCQRYSYGVLVTTRSGEFPCPYCRRPCTLAGHAENGVRRYRCTGCGRKNTGLMPHAGVPRDGPYPHLRTFYLPVGAQMNLRRYCQATGMNVAQAVRAIFRTAADEPVARFAASYTGRRADGSAIVRVKGNRAAPVRPEEADVPFENVRAATLRKFWEEVHRQGVSGRAGDTHYRISIALDDKAKVGLLRTAARRGVTHQEAARRLLFEARW